MLKLQTRKIQQVNYSFLISLPKVWLENHGLVKGHAVELFLDDQKNLVIRPVETVEEK